MVMTLEDFLERRSRLMLYSLDNGIGIADAVARQIGTAHDWSEPKIAEAVARYQAHVDDVKSFQNEPHATVASAANA